MGNISSRMARGISVDFKRAVCPDFDHLMDVTQRICHNPIFYTDHPAPHCMLDSDDMYLLVARGAQVCPPEMTFFIAWEASLFSQVEIPTYLIDEFLEAPAIVMQGLVFGYPACCIREFVTRKTQKKPWKGVGTSPFCTIGFEPCHKHQYMIERGSIEYKDLIHNRIYPAMFPIDDVPRQYESLAKEWVNHHSIPHWYLNMKKPRG